MDDQSAREVCPRALEQGGCNQSRPEVTCGNSNALQNMPRKTAQRRFFFPHSPARKQQSLEVVITVILLNL